MAIGKVLGALTAAALFAANAFAQIVPGRYAMDLQDLKADSCYVAYVREIGPKVRDVPIVDCTYTEDGKTVSTAVRGDKLQMFSDGQKTVFVLSPNEYRTYQSAGHDMSSYALPTNERIPGFMARHKNAAERIIRNGIHTQ